MQKSARAERTGAHTHTHTHSSSSETLLAISERRFSKAKQTGMLTLTAAKVGRVRNITRKGLNVAD